MKIHFSNVNFSSNSGPNSFAHRLASQLTLMGHDIVGSNDLYESMLIFIEPTTTPRPEARVVQRLDGIWFKPDQFHTHNKLIKQAYDNSDHIIWQSEFDKKMTTKWWGDRKGSIIHNGIDFKTVYPNSDFLNWRKNYERVFVCSASWHRQKRLKENIDFFQKNSTNKDALLVLGKNPDCYIKSQNIFYLGNITHENCLEVYSKCDWMIHLAWLDHCPNVVVEALSQGCPVICTDSGGTREIVKNNGIIIKENNQYNFELADYDNPYELDIPKVELEKIEIKCDYLNIKSAAEKYISVLKGV